MPFPPGICDALRSANSTEYSDIGAAIGLSIGFGASRAGFDTNGATLFCVSGRAGLAFLSIRMRGGADLVEAAVEAADDGREGYVLANVVVMTGATRGVFEDTGVCGRCGDEVGREGGKSLKGGCAVGAEAVEGVCTSSGADEKGIAYVVECMYTGRVS